MKNLKEVLVEQLKDIYSAETQLIEALPKMVENADNDELSKAFGDHLQETKNQLTRLKKVMKLIDADLEGHTCQAMKGILKEAQEVVSDDYKEAALKDVMLVSAAQRVEHYEIAAYGNAIALAEFLEFDDIAGLLRETIKEEEKADQTLTKICQSSLYEDCSCSKESDASLLSGIL